MQLSSLGLGRIKIAFGYNRMQANRLSPGSRQSGPRQNWGLARAPHRVAQAEKSSRPNVVIYADITISAAGGKRVVEELVDEGNILVRGVLSVEELRDQDANIPCVAGYVA